MPLVYHCPSTGETYCRIIEMLDIGKWQFIRVIDVLFLGPFMMWLSVNLQGVVERWVTLTLMFFGATTILVNLYFFLKTAKLV